ncbi:bacteriohemerythrin [Frigidibacter sp. ROC022]|uniref:bacteriohemerythrin n=1 Tax=Frigidibacter sp. ROC022 TaxID=2971796 RepID=UPI00215A6949|nr:hemerythrin domain-containing protein [Frigidibacter sp. ROC022]MCR8726396.1 hemerythrin domain-containing protein [Frigidibacter sp. ROC022]
MKWTEEHATGVPVVDDQHRALFAFSEELRDVLENDAGEKTYDLSLDFLKTYAEVHFGIEEKCMLAHLCPVAGRNRKEHGAFTRMIAEEEALFRSQGFDRQRALELTDRIDQWLDSHIRRIDTQLRDVVTDGDVASRS